MVRGGGLETLRSSNQTALNSMALALVHAGSNADPGANDSFVGVEVLLARGAAELAKLMASVGGGGAGIAVDSGAEEVGRISGYTGGGLEGLLGDGGCGGDEDFRSLVVRFDDVLAAWKIEESGSAMREGAVLDVERGSSAHVHQIPAEGGGRLEEELPSLGMTIEGHAGGLCVNAARSGRRHKFTPKEKQQHQKADAYRRGDSILAQREIGRGLKKLHSNIKAGDDATAVSPMSSFGKPAGDHWGRGGSIAALPAAGGGDTGLEAYRVASADAEEARQCEKVREGKVRAAAIARQWRKQRNEIDGSGDDGGGIARARSIKAERRRAGNSAFDSSRDFDRNIKAELPARLLAAQEKALSAIAGLPRR